MDLARVENPSPVNTTQTFDLTDADMENPPQETPIQSATPALHEATLQIVKSMETLEKKMNDMFAILQAKNLDIENSFTTLRNEIRGTNSNIHNATPTANPGEATFSRQLPSGNNAVTGSPSNISQNNPCRQKKIYPLPKFAGLAEDWPTFNESFKTSTTEFEYSDLHNIMRLREALEGEAKETVDPLLSNAKNVSSIMNILGETFGRPEQLIKSQINKIRSLHPIDESDLNALATFANKVTNMVTFIDAVEGNHHLVNPMLLSELILKLPTARRLQWANKSLELGRMATIRDFSLWLNDIRKAINMVTDFLPTTEPSSQYACVSVESVACIICQRRCKSVATCNYFIKLSPSLRWEKVKSHKLCFSCLKRGHRSINCSQKIPCGRHLCERYHHRLLHNENSELKNVPVENACSLESPCSTKRNISRSCLTGVNCGKRSVLFQFVPVKIFGKRGKSEICVR